MNNQVLVGLFVAIAAGLLSWMAVHFFIDAGQTYRERFTSHAKVKIADLYLMIEPEKLFALNLILLVITFVFIFFWLGSIIVALIISFLCGLLPKIIFKVLTKRRQTQFLTQLPDMLQTSSTAMKAGSSLNHAIESVVVEETGPISQEFDLFLRELRVGVDFNEALENIYKRMPLLDFKLVVSGMQISREIGGNLADTLERLASTLRKKLEMEGKIDSLTAQGRAQGIVMTLLPLVLGYILFLMEPEQMSLLWTEWYGWLVIALVAFMEIAGFFVIRKIVNIDV
jgi:tight adherence protein B